MAADFLREFFMRERKKTDDEVIVIGKCRNRAPGSACVGVNVISSFNKRNNKKEIAVGSFG